MGTRKNITLKTFNLINVTKYVGKTSHPHMVLIQDLVY